MILETLLPKARRELLALLFLDPGKSFHVRELSRRLKTGHGVVQREVAHLVEAGLLSSRREGQKVLYRANTACFVFPDVRSLIEKTAGPAGRVRDALLPLASRIRVAFLYGSIAARAAKASSDVDLMVIGPVTFGEVAEALPPAEESLGREVNATVYPVEEFRSRLARGNVFLKTVIRGPKAFVIGDASDLESLG